jgi:hypothetical protein
MRQTETERWESSDINNAREPDKANVVVRERKKGIMEVGD